jgi:hypothetical protein
VNDGWMLALAAWLRWGLAAGKAMEPTALVVCRKCRRACLVLCSVNRSR